MIDFQPIRFGKYQLLKKIAKGGMAELFLARITGFQGFEKRIVIKKILPHLSSEKALVKAFVDEAKLAALLQHQNIVQIYDFGCMDGEYFIAMEFLNGRDLRSIMEKSRAKNLPLSLENALYITSRICAGLDYAQHLTDFEGKPLNIIHRDISPQNVLITQMGEVKIVDFGIAKAVGRISTTQVGKIKGKVAYMSPEQAQGKSIDHRSDIFSTGILLYEMITRRRMFKGEVVQILAKVREAEFEPADAIVTNLPPKLITVLDRALARDPAKRYASASEMLADLDACMDLASLRPSARKLSRFMEHLFGLEAFTETVTVDIDLPQNNGREGITAPGFTKEDPGPDKTQTITVIETETKRHKGWLVALTVLLSALTIGGIIGVQHYSLQKAYNSAMEEMKAGRFPKAVALFDAIIDNDKDIRAEVSQPLAEALVAWATELPQSDYPQAEELLKRAVNLDPANAKGYFQLGLHYGRAQQYPRAIEMYQKVIALSPEFTNAFFNLGYIYAITEAYAEAEQMYRRTVELAPRYLDEALYNLAVVQHKLGKIEECIRNLEQALIVNPENQSARAFLQKL